MASVKSEPTQKKDWTSYFWDDEKSLFLGRSAFGWRVLCLYLSIFYIGLIVFFICLLLIFFETINHTTPKWYGEESLTQNNPGLGMRPLPRYDSTLISFAQGKPSTFKPYTDHIEAFLLQYDVKLQQGRDLIDCEFTTTSKDVHKACRVDLDRYLGPCTKDQDFGYEDGKPCVLLKMNKVFDFVPEVYNSSEELKNDNDLSVIPRFLAFTPKLTVGVSCDGENAADRENINEIKFFPPQGIPAINYPYRNQEGYRSPFIMAQFTNVTKRVLIQITCTLFARNIDNSGSAKRHGTIRFELLKD